jgi:hypothetical protein
MGERVRETPPEDERSTTDQLREEIGDELSEEALARLDRYEELREAGEIEFPKPGNPIEVPPELRPEDTDDGAPYDPSEEFEDDSDE